MPQGTLPVLIVNSSPMQEPISLQAAGNMIVVGAPGGPVVFSTYGAPIITGLSGSIARTIVAGHNQ